MTTVFRSDSLYLQDTPDHPLLTCSLVGLGGQPNPMKTKKQETVPHGCCDIMAQGSMLAYLGLRNRCSSGYCESRWNDCIS